MAEKEKPEVLDIGSMYADAFRAALEETSRKTYISNSSITVNDEGRITIEPTKASFLLSVGMNYQKQIDAKKKTQLVDTLAVMTELCFIKYGNLDKDVFAKIQEARALVEQHRNE